MSDMREYAVEDCIDTGRFERELSAVRNALGCDCYREEVENARRAVVRLGDECERLAGDLATLAGRAPRG